MRLGTIRDRVVDVLEKAPFGWAEAQTPFSFDLQPAGEVDQVFRIETEGDSVIGGFNYTEERSDLLQVWVARTYDAAPEATYRSLVNDAASIRAAVIRDGHEDSGEYIVPDDGAGMTIQRDPGKSYAVMRVTVPVNYETTS